ncbi:MAG: outer membrane protein assembly factor BamD, partial [Desulfobacterales bacterium]|nr:outer membrane protein assembly factor BamD [Desulfobacterales bacterium]
RIARCIDNIVGHELYVADFYFKTQDYRAALKRYEHIVEFYPETAHAEIALGKIPACQKALKDKK